MKNTLISRFAVVALLTGGLCYGNVAYGQARAKDTDPDSPSKVGSMAATGAKPSKAELAKMEAEKGKEEGAKPATETKKPAAAATAEVSAADRAFMMEAAKGGMKEVHMGQMAMKNSQNAEIKKLGTQIAADHSKANNELMALAQSKGVKLDPKPKMKMDKLSKENWDQQWLAMMEKDHQQDIAAFEKAARGANDKDLKSWAKKTLPTLKKHLKMVQAAQKKMTASASR